MFRLEIELRDTEEHREVKGRPFMVKDALFIKTRKEAYDTLTHMMDKLKVPSTEDD